MDDPGIISQVVTPPEFGLISCALSFAVDFNAPFEVPGAQPPATQSSDQPSEDAIVFIESMGFTRPQALKALKATNNNLERAADWIFSHMDELDAPV
jgi:uncharacterized UBP type Zn finger protein